METSIGEPSKFTKILALLVFGVLTGNVIGYFFGDYVEKKRKEKKKREENPLPSLHETHYQRFKEFADLEKDGKPVMSYQAFIDSILVCIFHLC